MEWPSLLMIAVLCPPRGPPHRPGRPPVLHPTPKPLRVCVTGGSCAVGRGQRLRVLPSVVRGLIWGGQHSAPIALGRRTGGRGGERKRVWVDRTRHKVRRQRELRPGMH